MSKAVVDIFEAVQIQVHQSQLLTMTLSADHGLTDPILEHGSVGQSSQCIMLRQKADGIFGFPEFGDIRHDGDVIDEFTVTVVNHADG